MRWVRHHQERIDGTGYPDGLQGDTIPDGARILCVADSSDVMISGRPYRSPLSADDAIAECRTLAGRQFCPTAVAALVELWDEGVYAKSLRYVRADA